MSEDTKIIKCGDLERLAEGNAKDESTEKIVPKNGNILHKFYLKLKKPKEIEIKKQNINNVEKQRDGSSIPTILIDCVEIVESKGINEEIIYGGSVPVKDVQAIKDLYEKNPNIAKISLQQQSPQVAAHLLKQYLRDLSEPILTHDYYPAFVNSVHLDKIVREEYTYKLVNKSIPEANKTILIFIFNHLLKIANNCAKNRMPIKNLSILFGALLLSPAYTCTDTNNKNGKETAKEASIIEYMLELHSAGRLFENTSKKETQNNLNNQFVNMVINTSNISSPSEDTNKQQESMQNYNDSNALLLCIEAIEETGLKEDGIYREAGSAQVVKEMVGLYATDLEKFKSMLRETPKVATSVLKYYLEKAFEPLITADLYQDFIDSIESSKDEIVCKERIRTLFNDSIPKEDKIIIIFILDHLIKVSKHSETNRMGFTNLANIFGPKFLKDKNEHNLTYMTSKTMKQLKQQATVVKYLLQLRSDDQLKQ